MPDILLATLLKLFFALVYASFFLLAGPDIAAGIASAVASALDGLAGVLVAVLAAALTLPLAALVVFALSRLENRPSGTP